MKKNGNNVGEITQKEAITAYLTDLDSFRTKLTSLMIEAKDRSRPHIVLLTHQSRFKELKSLIENDMHIKKCGNIYLIGDAIRLTIKRVEYEA